MKIHGEKVLGVRPLCAGSQVRLKRSELKPGEMYAFLMEGGGTLFTCYRPPRKRSESPVQYYRRHKCVDDNFTRIHNGYYYCNPAHCSSRWNNKADRDEHLGHAYGALL